MNELPAKRRRGCLFYGCLTSSVLALFLLIGLLLGLRELRSMVNQFTDSRPVTFPTVTYTPEQRQELDHRLEAFSTAIKAKQAAEPLVLTADDLNVLVATAKGAEALRGRFHFAIEGDRLEAEASLPMGELGFPLLKGRHLNATASVTASVQDGRLLITPQTLKAKGKAIPGLYADRLRQQNLAESLAGNPDAATFFNEIQSIEIKDGKIRVVPKVLAGGNPAPEATPAGK